MSEGKRDSARSSRFANSVLKRVSKKPAPMPYSLSSHVLPDSVGQQPSSLCSEIMVSSMAMLRSRAVRVEPA